MNPQQLNTDNDICSLITGKVPDYGKFYGQDEAAERIKHYFDETGLDPKNPNVIFGQLLGLNSVRAFLDKIDEYNNEQEPDNKIAGIRIYNAMSKRSFLAPSDCDGLKLDVIIVPVLANGDDIFKVAPMIDRDLALGDAMPCPNQCGTRFM